MHLGTVDCDQVISCLDSGACCRRVRRDMPRLNSLCRVPPGDAIVRSLVAVTLIEVQNGENYCGQSGQRQNHRTEALA